MAGVGRTRSCLHNVLLRFDLYVYVGQNDSGTNNDGQNLPNMHTINEIILRYSFTNTIHKATRITQHTNTLLDLILVNGFVQGDVLDSGAIDVEKTL